MAYPSSQATYCRVLPTFWNDPKIKRRLSRDQKHLLLYFFTSPHTNMIGLYWLPLEYAAREAEVELDQVREWVAGPLAPFVSYDEETEEVLVHRAARHQIGEELKAKDNRVAAVNRLLAGVHSQKLLDRFRTLYPDWPVEIDGAAPPPNGGKPLSAPGEAPSVAPSEPQESPSEAITSTRQQQKQNTPAAGEASIPGDPAHACAPTREEAPGEAGDAVVASAEAADGPAAAAAESDPDEGKEAATEAMRDALRRHIKRAPSPEARTRFAAGAEGIVMGQDRTAWHDTTGTAVPWPRRPELLQLALIKCKAEKRWGANDLRSALRYVIPQQVDPFRTRSSEDPDPRPQQPTTRKYSSGDATAVGDVATGIAGVESRGAAPNPAEKRTQEEGERIAWWESKHPAEAKLVAAAVELELKRDPEMVESVEPLPERRKLNVLGRAQAKVRYREVVLQRLAPAAKSGAA